jgi:glycosyltransferase involved in cell wall biosynthesis
MNPRVTITIPVYNGEREIGDAIASVLSQSFEDYELLVIDDCSSDNTVEKVLQYSDQRIRLIRNSKNLGYQGNFDRCVNEAFGDYLKILCHDDVLLPGSLQKQVELLDKTRKSNVLMCCGKKRIINPQGKVIFPAQGFRGKSRVIAGPVAIKKCIRAGRNLIGETSVVLVRTEAFRNAGQFKENYNLDLEMWTRILRSGDLVFLDEEVSDFRLTPTAGTAKQALTQAIQTIAFFRRLRTENPKSFGLVTLILGVLRARINQIGRRYLLKRVSP